MSVAYIRDFYPERRCIIKKIKDIEYVFCDERLTKTRIIRKIERILLQQKSPGWNWLVYDPVIKPKADIVHTFNSVCKIGKIPWVVTFESTIPRTNQTVGRAWEKGNRTFTPDYFTKSSMRLLADNSCKACIALSDSAKRIQIKMLESMEIDASVIKLIREKIQVVHPPQEVFCTELEVRNKYRSIHSCMEFLFVGHDFFRKGGAPLIEVLEKMKHKGKIHLTVVSNLGYEQFASIEERKVMEKVLKNSDWITWFVQLPNEKVLELCKNAHIGCLPTLQDTYGYSILEMQACGLPVITTNVRACPEINNEICGWIVPLTLDNIGGEAIRYTERDRENRKEELLIGLEKCLTNIFKNQDMIEEKAIQALRRIERVHSPEKYAEKIKRIYESFL